MKGSPTAQLHFDGVRVARRPAHRRGGPGLRDRPVRPRLRAARHRGLRDRRRPGGAGRGGRATPPGAQQFGRPIADFQGLRFMLADMATQIEAGRALYLAAARLRDAGRPFSQQAAMAKLFCTDTAMKVTTDAVQVLGGYGYTADFPVER